VNEVERANHVAALGRGMGKRSSSLQSATCKRGRRVRRVQFGFTFSPSCTRLISCRHWTMERIAGALGVSFGTIQNDLVDLSNADKSKRQKTKTNPKGSGRPKGSKKSKAESIERVPLCLAPRKPCGMGATIHSRLPTGERSARSGACQKLVFNQTSLARASILQSGEING
jgi:hypothetical protein